MVLLYPFFYRPVSKKNSTISGSLPAFPDPLSFLRTISAKPKPHRLALLIKHQRLRTAFNVNEVGDKK
jgi:hypothetical protein